MADDDTQSDYCEDEEEEDDEATLDEEEATIGSEDDSEDEDELRLLHAEGELSLEELQRKYYGAEAQEREGNGPSDQVPPPLPSSSLPRSDGPSSVSITGVGRPTTSVHSAISLREQIISSIAGTCGQLSQTLSAYFHAEDLEEDDTEDYEPPEFLKKPVRVGDQFQVIVPSHVLQPPVPQQQTEEADDFSEMLWCPPSVGRCSTALIDAYLEDCALIRAGEKPRRKQQTVPSTTLPAADGPSSISVPDNEDALFALLKHNYEPKKAKESFLCSDGSSSAFAGNANAPKRTHPPCPAAWSDDECEQFENGMSRYYKCFWKIRRDYLPSRLVGELVTFYYSWKKSERYDLWKAEICQREQQVDAKTTDLMGRLAQSLFHGEGAAIVDEQQQEQQQQNGIGH